MPIFEHNSTTTRFDVGELIACAFAPVGNDDLTRKAYVDAIVGGLGYYMSQYPNPQAAVDAAILSGYKMVFVDDDFTITAPLDLTAAGAVDFALIGMGKDCGFVVNNAAATGALNIGQANVMITNFHIEVTTCVAAAAIVLANNADNFVARSISINVPALVVTATGFDLQNSLDLRILDCDIAVAGTMTTAGILMDAHCSGYILHDCHISGSFDGVDSDSSYGKISKGTIVSVTNNGIEMAAAAASTNCHIVDNHIDTCGNIGIIVAGVDNIVEENNLGTLTSDGIRLLAGADDCIVRGNRINGPGAAAEGISLIDCDTCVVSGNRISNCPGNGIELAGNSARNVINGNNESGCAVGIFLADTCDYNAIGFNQVPSGLDPGAAIHNEVEHNVV